jgi:hypothetical protein
LIKGKAIMIDNRDKIKMFMKLKEERLIECLPDYTPGMYYDQIIEDIIDKWSEDDAEKVFKRIVRNVGNCICFLTGDLCPFCIINNYDCFTCEYGEIKGVCGDDYSNYAEICCLLKVKQEAEGVIIFSNDFYKEAINKIERTKNE